MSPSGASRLQNGGRSNHGYVRGKGTVGMIYNFIEVICYYRVEPIITDGLRAWEGIRKNMFKVYNISRLMLNDEGVC